MWDIYIYHHSYMGDFFLIFWDGTYIYIWDRYIYHHSYMGEVAGWDGMVLIKQKNLGNDKYICIYMFLKISLIYIYIY
jgi:hypothetical protein